MEKDYLSTIEYSLFLSPNEVSQFYEFNKKPKTLSAP